MKKLLLLLILLSPGVSLACSCMTPSTETAYRNAKEVLLVEVLESRLIERPNMPAHVQAKFRVIEIFKGTTIEVKLLQSAVKGNCSVPLAPGHTYIVFSNGKAISTISKCTASRWISRGYDDEILDTLRSLSKK